VGASPFFPPEHLTDSSARAVLVDLIRTDPRTLGESRTRWTLAGIGRRCLWLAELSNAGRWGVLQRLDIRLKLGRDYIHSPDPNYLDKVRTVQTILRQCATLDDQSAVVFLDQMGYYRQPLVGRDYETKGHAQPLARRSYHAERPFRVVGALDPFSGRVLYWQGRHIDVAHLIDFYQQIVQCYGGVRTVYVIEDNWPIHFHPDVLAALVPQQFPWPIYRPPNWPTEPSTRARRLNLPIQMVMLPTYAPWTNPIEKLWRWLKQDVIYLHRWADRLPELHSQVAAFLDQFKDGSRPLLRYCGLTPNSRLYGEIMKLLPLPP
jgi:hypothetical protein